MECMDVETAISTIVNKMPKLSIIVPIYNVEKYLRQCVDSILAQSLSDIEVILVDDGSSDSCPQIVDEYAAKDLRVIPIHKKNGGLSSARNAGLEKAQGEYVGFVDSDDWLDPRMYEKLYTVAQNNDTDIAACGIQCEFLATGPDVDQEYYNMKFSGKLPLDASLLEKIDVSSCNKIFRRSVISQAPKLRFPDGLNFEDCEFFWRFLLRARSIFCIQENLYHYVRHGGGIMKETLNGYNPHALDAVKVCHNILQELVRRNELSRYACPFFLLLAGHYGMSARSNEKDAARETSKVLKASNWKRYRNSVPERENWAWEILDQIANNSKVSLSNKIWHTKNCKGISRSFFCGIRVIKRKIPESDIVFNCPELPENKGIPKVSVVVPIYNTEAYLRQSLDALCGQTLKEIEIICVDDGSKDSSPDILREYANRDARIKVISKANSGYGHSVNVGIDAASGEYLAIAEPDDYVTSEMYETLYNTAKEHCVPLVKCDWELFWEKNSKETRRERWRLVPGTESTVVFPPKENPVMIADASGIWAAVYSLAWLRKNNIRCLETAGASFQDTSFVVKSYLCAGEMAFVPKPFVSYRQSNPNSSINAGSAKAFCVFREFDEIIDYCKKHLIFDRQNKALVLKKIKATGQWNVECFTGDIKSKVKRKLKKYFRMLLEEFPERPPEIAPHEWEYILKTAELHESWKRKIKAFLFEESYTANSIRIKVFRIRLLKTKIPLTKKDSVLKKVFIRLLAAMFFSNPQQRKAFRSRHLNLDPRTRK